MPHQGEDSNLEDREADHAANVYRSSAPSRKDPTASHRLLHPNDGAGLSPSLATDRGSTASSDTVRMEDRTLLEKFGWIGITTLIVGTLVILAALGFLGFLWFADYENKTWQLIIVKNWATRAVSLSSLAIRTAISFQAGLATAMLAALVLERFGVLLEDSARISTLRASSPHPYNLAYPLVLGWKMNKSKIGITAIATLLVITTVLLQFTSTVLLADLKLAPIPGLAREDRNIAYDFRSVSINTGSGINDHYMSRPSTWTRKPPFYPTFAEYTEPPFIKDGVKDTGLTLRAFLPMESTQRRENIRNYTGKATVLDARVTCQKPALTNASAYYSSGMLTFAGQVSATTSTPRLDNSTVQPPITDGGAFKDLVIDQPFPFSCVAPIANAQTLKLSNFTNWQTSICQLEQAGTSGASLAVAGGLVSEFVTLRPEDWPRNLSDPNGDRWWDRYNVAYLVLNVTSGPSNQWEKVMAGVPGSRPPFYSEHDEWVDFVWSKRELVLSTTLCYTSYDSADLDVHIHSANNRTEPTPGYNSSTSTYTFGDIRRQLGQTKPGTSLDDRGLLTLEKKASWQSDFDRNHTKRFQSWLQNDGDMTGQNRSTALLMNGLNGNWSAPLWNPPSLSFSSPPLGGTHKITADGMYVNLFQEIIAAGGSVAFAIQSLITIFAGLAYYDQLPQFDLRGDATQINFIYMVSPQEHRGFSAVVVVLVIHLITVLAVTLWFCLESQFTLLGNHWLGVAQVVSSETDDTLAKVTTATDGKVGALLKNEDRKGQTVGIGRVDENGRVAIVRRVNKF